MFGEELGRLRNAPKARYPRARASKWTKREIFSPLAVSGKLKSGADVWLLIQLTLEDVCIHTVFCSTMMLCGKCDSGVGS
jgi:hypothetical protein